MATRSGYKKLDNTTLSDRELLHLIDDLAKQDAHGYVLADDVREALAFNSNGDGRAVVGRMIWMKRYGYLDRIDPRELGFPATAPPRYAITSEGRALMGGKINAAVQKALDKADPGTGLLVMREIAERSYVRGSQTTANATRRQWLHTAAKRQGR